jgi:membrane protein DedA with SNARE-associated domain
MEQIVEHVGDFIHQHQAYASLVTALIAFGESLVIIGFAIPATALMVILGGLIGAGTIEAGPVVAGAIIGAIRGDAVSYGMGRWIGPGAASKWPLNRYRSGLARTRLFFRKYGFASVFFGRFLGPVRSTIPLVAGMMTWIIVDSSLRTFPRLLFGASQCCCRAGSRGAVCRNSTRPAIWNEAG